MPNYIEEKNFRNNVINCLTDPIYPFNFIGPNTVPRKNENYFRDASILRTLAIDDTFHDLAQDRGKGTLEEGYDSSIFNLKGPANYLLTGKLEKSESFITHYTNELNGPRFTTTEQDSEVQDGGAAKKRTAKEKQPVKKTIVKAPEQAIISKPKKKTNCKKNRTKKKKFNF